jgi:hypothetical protein
MDQKDARASAFDTIARVVHPHDTSLLAETDAAEAMAARKVPLFLQLQTKGIARGAQRQRRRFAQDEGRKWLDVNLIARYMELV